MECRQSDPEKMRSATSSTPFARRFSTRLAATLGIILAASWGPLSHAFRFIEVSEVGESGNPEATRTVRIVLARDCAFESDSHKSKPASRTSKPKSDSEKPTTERLLNAAPETLEFAQSIHFDLSGVPAPLRISAWIGAPEVHSSPYDGRLSESSDGVAHFARGPPTA